MSEEAVPSEVHWAAGEPFVGAEAILEAAGVAAEHGARPGLPLSIVVVSADELTSMHAEFLDDDAPTDVITFDLGEDGVGPAGELYVSADRALEIAERRGVTAERELLLYVVHGVLHLCGFDDHVDEDRARMRAAESAVMQRIGQPIDDAPHDL